MVRTLLAAAAAALDLSAGAVQADELRTATFAGGCFWCVESDFDRIPGVVETVSGYTGGTVENPSYEQVSRGGTGHREAVRIRYDPDRVSYHALLAAFWRSVDPTDGGGQFCDRGHSYTTAIFVHDAAQRSAAEASKQAAQAALGQAIVTPVEEAGPFWRAEDYHQDYAGKNPLSYEFYRWSCGRNDRVEELWGEQAYEGTPKLG